MGLPDPKAFAALSSNPLYFLEYTLISSILLSSIARPSQLDSNQVKKVANKTHECHIRAVASGRSPHKP